jgi:hypothetical protein
MIAKYTSFPIPFLLSSNFTTVRDGHILYVSNVLSPNYHVIMALSLPIGVTMSHNRELISYIGPCTKT